MNVRNVPDDKRDIFNSTFEYLSTLNTKAYKDKYLMCNDVLSKNPFSSNFLNNIIRNNKIKKITTVELIININIYYIKSFGYYIKYCLEKLLYIKYKNKNINELSNLTIIDTFILCHEILKEKEYTEKFFDGIAEILKEHKKNYLILPVLINKPSLKSFLNLFKYCNVSKNNILFEYHLLSYFDYMKLLIYILTYPVKVLLFVYSLKGNNFIQNHLKNEMLISLKNITLQNYSRYLQGQQIAKKFKNTAKLISWYENQVIDKALYRGIKELNSDLYIIGARPYIFTDEMINEIPDDSEIPHLTVPDKIVVNGKIQIPETTELDYKLAPSFRYKRLFNTKIDFSKRNKILVVLTIYDHEIINVLDNINKLKYPKSEILIKFHPDVKIENYKELINNDAVVVEENIYDLFKITKFIIGISTGSLIEAACLAIPTIIIPHPAKFSLSFFTDCGKGIIWDRVDYINTLSDLIHKFNKNIKQKQNKLIQYSEIYKNLYLTEYNKKEIINAYELA